MDDYLIGKLFHQVIHYHLLQILLYEWIGS
jgi:hypothetical protein